MRSVEAKDQGTWYGFPEGHKEKGYSDYPAITSSAQIWDVIRVSTRLLDLKSIPIYLGYGSKNSSRWG